ncbi:uncharacterized protein YkwD [Flavimobilis soli]|uniref:Uncharacterized protein YkwD n=2 Tax=Flavimobilis soli TaxID=442709 RepID=A0A2A9E9M9_9MICO|nr:uncharacterized protein YkwD [Flavimobilis soli]
MTIALAATGTGTAAAASSPSIDRTSKTAVAKAYVKMAKTLNVSSGWTGKVKGCKIGTNSKKHDKASLATVNWARAQAGLSPARWDASWARQARAHALMTTANSRLTHDVTPKDKCFSKAAQVGGTTSNIAFGATGPWSVMLYLDDPGAHNVTVGHRRWILDPSTTRVGIGSTSIASSMKVFGDTGSDKVGKNPRFLPWPTSGYFPYEAEPNGRWSLTAIGADFTKAKVVVRDPKGKKLALKKAPAAGSLPDTISWDLKKWVNAPKGKKTATYKVTVTGIRWVGATGPKSYTYKVKLINAAKVAKKK